MSDELISANQGSPLVQATLIPADSAQVVGNKLYLLGGGVSIIGPKAQPLSMALLLRIPWDRANIPHAWKLEVVDEDGMVVEIGGKAVSVGGNVEAGRPVGAQPGSPLQVPMVVNFPNLPVPGGHTYVFRLSIDGATSPDWEARITVRAPDTATT